MAANLARLFRPRVTELVEPKQAGRFKTRLIQELLRRLNAEPERVKFPKSNMR